jgi:hypothetical protein
MEYYRIAQAYLYLFGSVCSCPLRDSYSIGIVLTPVLLLGF